MAEQLPTIGIHPGWYIAASVVCGLFAYFLVGGFTVRMMQRAGFTGTDCDAAFFLWPVALPALAGYYWAKACEPSEPKDK